MILIGSVGVTLITMSFLEKQGKISINHNILYLLILILTTWVGIWGLEEINKTFLINISK